MVEAESILPSVPRPRWTIRTGCSTTVRGRWTVRRTRPLRWMRHVKPTTHCAATWPKPPQRTWRSPGSYDALDSWLAANQTNPYSNVQLQDARVAPAQNAYLASQGIDPMNNVAANPEDVGAKAAFQNVLSLLGAGQQSWNQSRGAESQQARAYAHERDRGDGQRLPGPDRDA